MSIELLKGADYGELRWEHRVRSHVRVKDGKLLDSGSSEMEGTAARALKAGRLVFASEPGEGGAEAARRALDLASRKPGRTKLDASPPSRDSFSATGKEKLINVDSRTIFELLRDLTTHESLQGLAANAYLETEHADKRFESTEGGRVESKVGRVYLVMQIHGKEGERREMAHIWWGRSGGWDIVDQDLLLDKVEHEAGVVRRNLQAPEGPHGVMDLVLGPGLTGIASHEACGHPFEADRILGREGAQAGESFITPASRGTRLGSEAVNLVDDPTFPESYGFYLYDDEGVKARKRYLQKEGVVTEFLQDRATSAILASGSNAAARAARYDVEPIPRMANTYLEPGRTHRDHLIAEVKHGILMDSFNEWNIDDTRFNLKLVGREAYLVENGEIGRAVRGPVLEITTPALWSSVAEVADDLAFDAASCGKAEPYQTAPVNTGGATALLRNVRM
jgi:TldD protein